VIADRDVLAERMRLEGFAAHRAPGQLLLVRPSRFREGLFDEE
jgi:hypothetical protein